MQCTYEDCLSRAGWFLAERRAEVEASGIRACIETALREIVSERDWKCLKKIWRVRLQSTQTTGTVTYLADSGDYPHQITLTGATWPTWTKDAEIRVGTASIICEFDRVVSPTVAILRPPRVPANDVTTASSYQLGCSWYELPSEFAGAWSPAEKNAWFIGEYIPFEEMYLLTKYRAITGIVRRWSIGPVPNRMNSIALYVYPWSMATEEEDLLMKFRPRTLGISGRDAWNFAGTVTVTKGSRLVAGTNNTLRAVMKGAVIRFSADSSLKPTNTNGNNPYVFQSLIDSVSDDLKSLTIAEASPYDLTGVRYVISDPIELPQNMYDAFLRCIEKQLAYVCGMKDSDAIERQYQTALTKAKVADSPVLQKRVCGQPSAFLTRLRDFKNRPWI